MHKRGVDGERDRAMSGTRPKSTHPRDVEELTVLMQNVGREVIEQGKDVP
jgi:hypothetical protein